MDPRRVLAKSRLARDVEGLRKGVSARRRARQAGAAGTLGLARQRMTGAPRPAFAARVALPGERREWKAGTHQKTAQGGWVRVAKTGRGARVKGPTNIPEANAMVREAMRGARVVARMVGVRHEYAVRVGERDVMVGDDLGTLVHAFQREQKRKAREVKTAVDGVRGDAYSPVMRVKGARNVGRN